jgi:hypothetical protein
LIELGPGHAIDDACQVLRIEAFESSANVINGVVVEFRIVETALSEDLVQVAETAVGQLIRVLGVLEQFVQDNFEHFLHDRVVEILTSLVWFAENHFDFVNYFARVRVSHACFECLQEVLSEV